MPKEILLDDSGWTAISYDCGCVVYHDESEVQKVERCKEHQPSLG